MVKQSFNSILIGLYTNFTSFTPFSYKIRLIKTLLRFGFEISSSWNIFDQEKQQMKNLLMKTLYPSYLIDKEIKKFLENKFTTKENTNIDLNNKCLFLQSTIHWFLFK